MEVNMITNNLNTPIYFNGAFRIKPAENKAKAEIPLLFKQGKQIFHDILEKGDEVVVVRDNFDRRISSYIQENDIKGIEYYPQINTKSGLDQLEPLRLITLIKENTYKIITDFEEIIKVAKKQKGYPKTYSSRKEAEKIFNALRLNIERPIIKSTSQMTVIRDEHKKRTIEVIMNNPTSRYVHVIPDSLNESSTKCIINSRGDIVTTFDTPQLMRKFLIKFNKLKKSNANTLVEK